MEDKELNEKELEQAAGGKQTSQADRLGGRQILVPDSKKHKIRQADAPQQ